MPSKPTPAKPTPSPTPSTGRSSGKSSGKSTPIPVQPSRQAPASGKAVQQVRPTVVTEYGPSSRDLSPGSPTRSSSESSITPRFCQVHTKTCSLLTPSNLLTPSSLLVPPPVPLAPPPALGTVEGRPTSTRAAAAAWLLLENPKLAGHPELAGKLSAHPQRPAATGSMPAPLVPDDGDDDEFDYAGDIGWSPNGDAAGNGLSGGDATLHLLQAQMQQRAITLASGDSYWRRWQLRSSLETWRRQYNRVNQKVLRHLIHFSRVKGKTAHQQRAFNQVS